MKKIIIINVILLLLIGGVVIIGLNRSKPKNENRITISFNTNGAKHIVSKTINQGETIKLPSPEKEGYTFGGWYLNNEKVSSQTTFDKNVTLVAYWILNDAPTLTITFDTSGGTEIEKLVLECNRDLKLPTIPEKEGYRFVNWINSENRIVTSESKLPCEDITLTAKWEKIDEEKTEEVEEQKEYVCPEDYTLVDDKCLIEGPINQKCPSVTYQDGDACITLLDYIEGGRSCPNATVTVSGDAIDVPGEYFKENGEGYCGYFQLFNTESECAGKWGNNKCYQEIIKDNYQTTCSETYNYYSSTDLESKFGVTGKTGCYGIFQRIKICLDDYVLTDGKCIKTIDAELK